MAIESTSAIKSTTRTPMTPITPAPTVGNVAPPIPLPLSPPTQQHLDARPQLVTPQTRTRVADLAMAPAVQRAGDVALVPVDIQKLDLQLFFTADGHVRARAVVEFHQASRGYPILGLGPEPTKTTIDGRTPRGSYRTWVFPFNGEPPKAHSPNVYLPSGSRHRVLEERLAPGPHSMTVDYELNHKILRDLSREKSIGASNDGIKFTWRMDDRGGPLPTCEPVFFSEAYAPASMEYDHHPTTIEIRFAPGMRNHKVFSNGRVTRLDGDHEAYRVELPTYFNSSAPYLHITDPAHVVEHNTTYESIDGRQIPITIYADRTNFQAPEDLDIEGPLAATLETMAEMEHLVGPYPHASFVARICRNGFPSMEHAGATETSAYSLRHELIHSWWGRGVFPATGADGWLDEGMTYWFQHGRPTHLPGAMLDNRSGNELRALGPMQQHTNGAGWDFGFAFFVQLEKLLSSDPSCADGFLPLARELFHKYRHRSLTVDQFREFITERVAADLVPPLDALFERFGA